MEEDQIQIVLIAMENLDYLQVDFSCQDRDRVDIASD